MSNKPPSGLLEFRIPNPVTKDAHQADGNVVFPVAWMAKVASDLIPLFYNSWVMEE